MPVATVAMVTAGGLAPWLSSAVGGLIERYTEIAPDVRTVEFDRIAGGKAFDASVPWFTDLLRDLGQA